MHESEPPRGFISKEALFAALAAKGGSISEHQIERWREWGLLPPLMKRGLGQRGGSVSYYPAQTISQALAASRLFSTKRSKAFVSFELWWLGFEVDERYWRPLISARSKIWRSFLRRMAKLYAKAENDEECADIVFGEIPKQRAPVPIKGMARNLRQSDFQDGFHAILHALNGTFTVFHSDHVDPGADRQSDAVQSLLGFSQTKGDVVNGEQIRVREVLPDIFRAISECEFHIAFDDDLSKEPKLSRLLTARDEIRNALEISRNTHEALSWIYGSRAFGLKIARWYFEKASPLTKFDILLLWLGVRESGNDKFLTTAEIENLLEASRALLTQSENLRAEIARDPRLMRLLTAKRLKRGFQRPEKMAVLCREIEALRTQ